MQATNHLESIRPATQREMQNKGWRTTILAGLPHLLMGLLLSSNNFFPQNQSRTAQIISAALGISLAVLIVYVITRAARDNWPLWSASWYGYLAWVVLAVIGLLLNLINSEQTWVYTMGMLVGWLGAVLIGYFYLFTADRLRALLAILFLLPIIGLMFIEFIPNLIEGVLTIGTGVLVAVTASLVLRSGDYRRGLLYSTLLTVVLSLSFAYVGVYQASNLPDFITFSPRFSDFVSILATFLAIGAFLYGFPPLVQWMWSVFHRDNKTA